MSGARKFWIGLVVVAVLAITVYLARTGRVSPGSVLVIDLTGPVEEQKATGFLGTLFGGDIVVLHQVLDAVDAAKTDSRVVGAVERNGSQRLYAARISSIIEADRLASPVV